MPADVIQPIGKVLRLCQALVVAQHGDAVYPSSATTANNDERGLGRLVVKQENMPYTTREEAGGGTTVLNFNTDQAMAEKFMRCGLEYRNTAANSLQVTLPSADKLIAMGCKLGDRGSVRVTAENSDGAGANTYSFTALGDNKTFGIRSWTSAATTDAAGFVLDWKLQDNDGDGTAVVIWIITGGVA